MRKGLMLLALLACGGGLKLTGIKSSNDKPSNVAVYFKVEKSNKDPIGGLAAESFKIYEDDQLVSQYESKQTILNPDVAVSHFTLLLVDMSGSIVESGTTPAVVEAANAFVDKVPKEHKVAVMAFDGAEELHPIAPFASGGGAKGGLATLTGFKPSDPSTNLNGAVVKGLKELDKALATATTPMRFGTLVVFTDGSDRAHRVSEEDMRKALRDTQYDVFAIGLGVEMKESELGRIGKDGTAKADDKAQVTAAFDKIATRIEAQQKAFYLLSYCSPSRAGKHHVKIEAVVKDPQDGEISGSMEREFDATGFTKGCDPNQKPNFDLSKGEALAPKDDDKDKKDKPKGGVSVQGGVSTSGSGGTSGGTSKPAASGSSQEQFNP